MMIKKRIDSRISKDGSETEERCENNCALCSLSESAILSQGALKVFKSTIHFNTNNILNLKNFLINLNTNETSPNKLTKVTKIKTTLLLKLGVKFIPKILFDELNKIGWSMDNLKISDMFDLNSDSFFVHSNCYIWSYGILFDSQNNLPNNLDKIIFESLTKKCKLCSLFGASLKCLITECDEVYHYPCGLLANCYFNLTSHQILCPNHLEKANLYFNNKCVICSNSDRIKELLLCTTCGFYYHANCLSPPIEISPLMRLNWQCPDCKICQICRNLGDDNKMLVCDTCDKCYHVYCLKDDLILKSNVNGWKCEYCRKELNLTRCCLNCKNLVLRDSLECLCENCVELKKSLSNENKKRSVKDLLQLSQNSNISSTEQIQNLVVKKESEIKEPSKSSENLVSNIKLENVEKNNINSSNNTGTGKPSITTKKKQISKKNSRNIKKSAPSSLSQMTVSTRGSRTRNSGKNPKIDNLPKKSADSEENENQKNKTNQEEGTIGSVKRDDEDHHAVTVISSLEDSFTLKQDMCLSCGSFGKETDGVVISCSQCGQSFHNYCAGINNVCDIMLEKGWRCLDCTVCEGCGKATDEGLLLLCDDCDISYHIYCLNPPLDQVPKGNWKCKWCVKCLKCGSKQPGINSEWKSNYTECENCFSLNTCHVCLKNYNESDIIAKCSKCQRWSHPNCDSQISEEEAQKKIDQNFECNKCNTGKSTYFKEQNSKPSHFDAEKETEALLFLEEISNLSKRYFLDDGIFLTDCGSDLLKKLKLKPPPNAKKNRVLKSSNTETDKATRPEKIFDENSQSSNEDKTDVDMINNLGDYNEPKQDDINKKNTNITKRQINIGVGGFGLKSRIRNKPALSNDQNDPNTYENENKTIKRKKKTSYEDLIPSYIQEAFFGLNTLATCKDVETNFDEPGDGIKMNKNVNKIHLDEEIFKLAQQNKKENLELGIEDFLDGDIVSYLFNENRNLMEFNPDQDLNNKTRSKDNYDEKIFDEKIYEDLFHQIVSENPKNSNSVDEYLNLNQPNEMTVLSKDNLMSSSVSDIIDHRNIDNLARQFKESTHKYAQSNNEMNNKIPQQMNLFSDQNNMSLPQHEPNLININQQLNKAPIQNQYNLIMNKIDDKKTFTNPPSPKPINNEENIENMNNNQNNKNIKFLSNFLNEANNFNQNQQEIIIPSNQLTQQKVIESLGTDQHQMSFEEESSNDCFNPPSQIASSQSKEDSSKHQKVLEKYAEDEDLGEFATQAMPLYSNLNFPNLKNEIKDIAERYRYIHKIWRKLDAQVKLTYINKSRQNRSKKKNVEKVNTAIGSAKNNKRTKSPNNNEKQAEIDNFSRSVTPSLNHDGTDDSNQMNLIKSTLNDRQSYEVCSQEQDSSKLMFQKQNNQMLFLSNKEDFQNINLKMSKEAGSIYEKMEKSQILHHHLQQQQQQLQNQMQNKPEKVTIKAYLNNQIPINLNQSNSQINLITNEYFLNSNNNQNQNNIHQNENLNKILINNFESNQSIVEKANSGCKILSVENVIQAQLPQLNSGYQSNIIYIPKEEYPQKLNNQIQNLNQMQFIKEDNSKLTNETKNEEISEHIDNIINEVASGLGTIPYMIDCDEDETNSSFQSQIEKNILDYSNQSSNSCDKPMKNSKKKDSFKLCDEQNTKFKKQRKQKNENEMINDMEEVVLTQNKQATKINEILMLNQNYEIHQKLENSNFPKNNDTNNNLFFIQEINSIGTDSHQSLSNKIICRDDNLKKILLRPSNELMIVSNNSNINTINESVKNILNEPQSQMEPVIKADSIFNQQNFKLITSNTGNTIEKMLQLDGTMDDLDEMKNDKSRAQTNNFKNMINNSMMNIDNLQSSSQTLQSNGYQIASKNESSSSSKLNTKVVINHELLNSYGITLNPSQPVSQNFNLNEQMNKNLNQEFPKHITNFNPMSQSGMFNVQQQQSYPIVMQQQYENKNFNQIIYASNDQNSNQIKHENFVNNNNNNNNTEMNKNNLSFNVSVQNMMPKVNGENTLLKALLQTAPKNVQLDKTLSLSEPKELNEAQKPGIQSIKAVDTLISTPLSPSSKKSKAAEIVPKKPKNPSAKLMVDLKNKIIESSINSEKLKNLEIVENTKSNARKRKNIKTLISSEFSVENLYQKMLEELKSIGNLYMSHPCQESNLSILNFPEKQHFLKIKNSKAYTSGKLFNLVVEFELNEKNYLDFVLKYNYSLFDSTKKNSPMFPKLNDEISLEKKLALKAFKICTSKLEEPILVKNINTELLIDSKSRLQQVLESKNPSFDENSVDSLDSVDKSNHTEYLKILSNNIDSEFSERFSPVLELDSASNFSIQSDRESKSKDLTSTTFKLNNKAALNLKETLNKLSSFLCIQLPTSIDLAKSDPSSNSENQIEQKQNHNPSQEGYKLNQTETCFTLSNLTNLTNIFPKCKFCDSLIAEQSACLSIDNFNISNENKENQVNQTKPIKLCSEFCKNSYLKVLKIKKSSSKFSQISNTGINNEEEQKAKNIKYFFKWNSNLPKSLQNVPKIDQVVHEKFEALKPLNFIDKRVCIFCNIAGDQEPNGPCRLLTVDVDSWSHLNCALWSDEVYETMNGALINVDIAYKKSKTIQCCYCHQLGASLRCFSPKCNCYYHLPCAIKDKCVFNQDKTVFCSTHSVKAINENRLTDLTVHRSVWIQRDEVAQIQSFMSRDIDENHYAIRIGSLILHNIGQLLPHQINSGYYNNRDFIYPIGYKATRIYWSMKKCFKRCRYECEINELDGKPEFSITILEEGYEKEVLVDEAPNNLWKKILEKIESMRKEKELFKIFPVYFSGEYMFGLTEPHIIRLVESLPGVENLTNYAFKYGKLQLLDMPLTINPTGCARSEPKLRTHFRKSRALTCNATNTNERSESNGSNGTSSSNNNYTYETCTATHVYNDADDDDANDEDDYLNSKNNDAETGLVSYSKQFVLSKSTQFRKLKTEWRSNVYLAKSKIQGLGLYAARDLEKNTLIIEYIGELIRNEVANRREKLYESQNRGIYMFRLNDDHVVDATISGGLARYINHCCDPNCVAETVSLEKDQKIIIIANKKILKGEELTYDYKFEFEDENNKISCLCGSANCKKWMN